MKMYQQISPTDRPLFWVRAWSMARDRKLQLLMVSKHALPKDSARYLRCEARAELAKLRLSEGYRLRT